MEGNLNGGGGGSGNGVVRNVTPSSQFQDRLVQALNNKETENRGLKVQVQNLQENLNGRNNCLQYLDSGINSLIETLRLTSSSGDNGGGGGGECSTSSGGGGDKGGERSVDFYTVLNIPGDLFEEVAQQHFQNKLGELSKLFWGTVEGFSGKLEKTEKELVKSRKQIVEFFKMIDRLDPTKKMRKMMMGDLSGAELLALSGENGGDREEEEEATVDLNLGAGEPLGGVVGGSFEEEQSGEDEESGGENMETEGSPRQEEEVEGGDVGQRQEEGITVGQRQEEGISVGGFPYPVVVKVEPGTCPLDGFRVPRKCKNVRHARDWNHNGLRIACLCGIPFLTKKAFERHLSRNKIIEARKNVKGGEGQGSSSTMNGNGGRVERTPPRSPPKVQGEEMPTSSAERVKVDGRRQRVNNLGGGRRASTSPERKRRKRGPYMTKMTRTKKKGVGAVGGGPVPDSTTSQVVVVPGRKRGRKPSKSKEIRFKCDLCELLFKSVSLVKNHKRNAHDVNDVVFKIGCKECGLIFLKREEFAKHRINEHGTQYGGSRSRQSESPKKETQREPQEPKIKRRRRSRKEMAALREAERMAIAGEMENEDEEMEQEEIEGGEEEMEETLGEENTEVWADREENEEAEAGEEEEELTQNVNGNGTAEEEEQEAAGAELVAPPPPSPPMVLGEIQEQGVVAGEETLGGTRANSIGNLKDLLRFSCPVCNEEFRSRGCLQMHMGQKHTVGMPKLKKKSSLIRRSSAGSGASPSGNNGKSTPKKVSFHLPPDLDSTFELNNFEDEEEDGEDNKEDVMTMAQQANGGNVGGEVTTEAGTGAQVEEGRNVNVNGLSPERETPHFVATIPLGGQAPGGTCASVVIKTETEEPQAEAE